MPRSSLAALLNKNSTITVVAVLVEVQVEVAVGMKVKTVVEAKPIGTVNNT